MIIGFACGGALAGAGGAVLCGRLRRGAPLPLPVASSSLAALWAVVAWCDAPAWWLPVPLALGWLGMLLTATDLQARRLPDALTIPAAVGALSLAGVAALGAGDSAVLGRAVVGALCWSGAYGLVRLISRGALGAGDCKLALSLGAVTAAVSWSALLTAMTITTVLGGLVAVGALASARSDFPHGPAMLLAAWTVVLTGSP